MAMRPDSLGMPSSALATFSELDLQAAMCRHEATRTSPQKKLARLAMESNAIRNLGDEMTEIDQRRLADINLERGEVMSELTLHDDWGIAVEGDGK